MKKLLILSLLIPSLAFGQGACFITDCTKAGITATSGIQLANKSAAAISLLQNIDGTAKGLTLAATSGDATFDGAVAATTTVTAGTGITATTGNITATAGSVVGNGLSFPVATFEAVAGAGTTVADAAALSASDHIHQLTGANGTVGWKFATSVAGQFEILLNTTAGVPKIYAASGGTCNGGAADAACTLVTGIVAHICYSTAVNTWICA